MGAPDTQIVLTNNGWAAAAYLFLKRDGLVHPSREADVRALLAPLFEKAERVAFDRAMATLAEKG